MIRDRIKTTTFRRTW